MIILVYYVHIDPSYQLLLLSDAHACTHTLTKNVKTFEKNSQKEHTSCVLIFVTFEQELRLQWKHLSKSLDRHIDLCKLKKFL